MSRCGAGLLAVRIDIGGGLGHCGADSVARMESRTGTENGTGNGRRGIHHVVREIDRQVPLLAKDGRQARSQREGGTGCEDGTNLRGDSGSADSHLAFSSPTATTLMRVVLGHNLSQSTSPDLI